MPKYERYDCFCENCLKSFKVDVISDLSDYDDSNYIKDMMEGKIFYVRCESCGTLIPFNHPFMFHFLDKKIRVQYNSAPNILYYNSVLEKEKSEYKAIGVISFNELISAILSISHDLDPFINNILLDLNREMFLDDYKKENLTDLDISLVSDNGLEGDLFIEIMGYKNNDLNKYRQGYNYANYLEVLNLKEYIDKLNLSLFPKDLRERIYKEIEKGNAEFKSLAYTYYLVDVNGNIVFSYCPLYLKKEIKEDDEVILFSSDKSRYIGKAKMIKEFNKLTLPFENMEIFNIKAKRKKGRVEGSSDLSLLNNNSNLLDKLINLKKHDYGLGSENFPTKELEKAYLLIRGNVNYVYDKEALEEGFKFDSVIKDGRRYLLTYINKNEESNKDNKLNFVFNFDDLVHIVFNDDALSGIIIKDKEEIILDLDTLLTYIKFKTLTDEDRMKELLMDLNEDEIKAMGELSYKCIKDVYLLGINPRGLMDKYQLSKEEVDKALTIGYTILREIVVGRY